MPRTTSCTVFFFPVLCRVPPGGIFTRLSVAMRAHVRQCDPSLSLNGRNDPPQEDRALRHLLLHDTLSLVDILTQFTAAHQLRHLPGIELVTPQQLRPVVRSSCLDRFSVPSCLGRCTLLLSRSKASSSVSGDSSRPTFAQFQCRRRVLQAFL